MKFSTSLFLLSAFMLSCGSEPETKEKVMEAFLIAIAECDTSTLNNLSINKTDYVWDNYETEIINIDCSTEGKRTSCCCEEEIIGHSHFNGRIYSKYSMEEIEGNWKVGNIFKESDFGRRYHTNICE